MAPSLCPPDLDRHVLSNTPVEQMWKFLNLPMLFTKNLGFRGSFAKALERGDEKAVELNEKMSEAMALYRATTQPKAVMQFFRTASDGNTLSVHDASGEFLCDVDFPRQDRDDFLCLADYFLPDRGDGPEDYIGMFVVTAGKGIAAAAAKLKDEGEYLMSHMVQALAMGTAEAYAEQVHALMRARWGFPDPVELDMRDIFNANYQGKRYSFGYPACPDMQGQDDALPESVRAFRHLCDV
jgi:5-methyltetrahydrofolate--homocysteine methyltransferase